MNESRGPDRWLFDVWSRFYDLSLVQRLVYLPLQDAVMRALCAKPGSRILDVGCGTGLLATRIREEIDDVRVFGCDFSRGMLREASRRAPDVGWMQGDALRLPLRDASFDVVVSTEAFHWFPDQLAALREFRRVLAPGGRLLVVLVHPAFEVVSRAVRVASELVGEPIRWPTREHMRGLLRDAGFRVVAQQQLWRVLAGLLLPPVLSIASRDD
jgi:ubiquinone/menaquinone biosynthesis C-methylase UbiE